MRSTPPVCMSNLEPQTSDAIAEHSICHPGLPAPHGDGQLGSPALLLFHNAKSFGDLFSAVSSDRSPVGLNK